MHHRLGGVYALMYLAEILGAFLSHQRAPRPVKEFIRPRVRVLEKIPARLVFRRIEMISPLVGVRCNFQHTRNALTSLGLHNLLELDNDGSAWKTERELVAKNLGNPLSLDEELSKREKTGNILTAHEALVEANSENYSRFKDVLEYLKDDLNADESTCGG